MSFYLCVYLLGFSIFSPSCVPEFGCSVNVNFYTFVCFLVCLQLHASNKVGFEEEEDEEEEDFYLRCVYCFAVRVFFNKIKRRRERRRRWIRTCIYQD